MVWKPGGVKVLLGLNPGPFLELGWLISTKGCLLQVLGNCGALLWEGLTEESWAEKG